jgi:hypothetical protein
VKTGVHAVIKALKILDSGFRRNDGKKRSRVFSQLRGGESKGDIWEFFTLSGGLKEILERSF